MDGDKMEELEELEELEGLKELEGFEEFKVIRIAVRHFAVGRFTVRQLLSQSVVIVTAHFVSSPLSLAIARQLSDSLTSCGSLARRPPCRQPQQFLQTLGAHLDDLPPHRWGKWLP